MMFTSWKDYLFFSIAGIILGCYIWFAAIPFINSANELHITACKIHIISVENYQKNWCATKNDDWCDNNSKELEIYRKCLKEVKE